MYKNKRFSIELGQTNKTKNENMFDTPKKPLISFIFDTSILPEHIMNTYVSTWFSSCMARK